MANLGPGLASRPSTGVATLPEPDWLRVCLFSVKVNFPRVPDAILQRHAEPVTLPPVAAPLHAKLS